MSTAAPDSNETIDVWADEGLGLRRGCESHLIRSQSHSQLDDRR